MMLRYAAILIAALAGAGVVSLLLRAPRAAQAPMETAAPVDTVALALELRADRVVASRRAVDAGQVIALQVANRAAVPLRLRLSGYEDRVDSGDLAPGATWQGAFLADRPGDDFAWLVGGRPAGRLDVRGSHLVEGHR